LRDRARVRGARARGVRARRAGGRRAAAPRGRRGLRRAGGIRHARRGGAAGRAARGACRLRARRRRAPVQRLRAAERARHLREGVAMTTVEAPLVQSDLELLDAYWRAANYLSVGQIYLLDNPLLREPLAAEHIKPRLLGHFGTTPGLNLIYTHLNRVIKGRDLDMIYVIGPGHGGPAIVAHTYLEGT